ncbi:MAG: DarT ssDNA thymidine ADP-ribosyltransferase family protein [Rhodoglobus sp.]
MSVECIHGLEEGLCGSCNPKEVVEVKKVTTTRAPQRKATPAMEASQLVVNVGEQRIYHLTHIRNLEIIVADGSIRADAVPAFDISSELTRELRRTAEVDDGVPVANFVPFFLAPNASLWEELRRGAANPRWSDAARKAPPADFVILASTISAIPGGAVIADGDAGGSLARFASSPADSERMLRRVRQDEYALYEAEALSPGTFPFAEISLIGVANDRARDRVKQLLAGSDYSPKISVYPPWFQHPGT